MEQQAVGLTPHWALTTFQVSTWARAPSSTNRASTRVAKWQSPVAGSKEQLWGREEHHVTGSKPGPRLAGATSLSRGGSCHLSLLLL